MITRMMCLSGAALMPSSAGAGSQDAPVEVGRLKRQLAALKTEMVSTAASQEQEQERMEQVSHPDRQPLNKDKQCMHAPVRL